MKKRGILNKVLAGEIAALGHMDEIVICNAGFPIPKGVPCIDLALTQGVPTLYQTLKAVLGENVVEKVYMSLEGENVSVDLYKDMKALFKNQGVELIPHVEFKKMSEGAKFIIRTGDFTSYASLILFTAAQAASAVEKYDVDTSVLQA